MARPAFESYARTREEVKALGYKALREIQDHDGKTVLTLWAGSAGVLIQQTWADTGDICFYRQAAFTELKKS